MEKMEENKMQKLYGVDLPELKKKNAKKILITCRDIHTLHINKRQGKDTTLDEWDSYWVDAYNLIIGILKERQQRTSGYKKKHHGTI